MKCSNKKVGYYSTDIIVDIVKRFKYACIIPIPFIGVPSTISEKENNSKATMSFPVPQDKICEGDCIYLIVCQMLTRYFNT